MLSSSVRRCSSTTMPFETLSPASTSQLDIRNNANTNQHQIGRANRAVAEDHLADLPLMAGDLRQRDAKGDLYALAGVKVAIEIREDGGDHPRHQPRLDLQHANRFPQRAGGSRKFEADESSADHDDIARVFQALLDFNSFGVGTQVADTVELGALYWQRPIARSHREHQRFIRKTAA